jgi:hypothetical protein
MIPIVPNQNTQYYTISFPFFFSNLEKFNGFEPLTLSFHLSVDLAVKYCREQATVVYSSRKEKLWACRYIAESQLHTNQTKAVREVVPKLL